ncbi:dihydrofolate reductase family protein [Micromonospora sp. WMMD1102]|uniref:dihydrofolate reductase family protein n=1 Tax=Micromonospora sp. WMMD1102 TaxID=3016105 RepID=UPI002414E49C|nr:dihydrofolate reductase family protein [Micromonospora sp. WMMD1102]MDG4791189.1 dihydrofolate reductase family protein [Micromonospora sp. WMMD1102]
MSEATSTTTRPDTNRKVIASTFVSLDGVIGNPHLWSLPYMDSEGQRYALDQLFASDALLLGRPTYDGFAQAWPNMPPDGTGFADRMNTIAKYVVSTTLEKAEWQNTTIINGNVAEEVAALKRQPGQDILMYGFGRLARTLLEHGLLDEVRFWLTPVLVGSGRGEQDGDLLFRETASMSLEFAGQRVLDSGVVMLSYRPTGSKQG